MKTVVDQTRRSAALPLAESSVEPSPRCRQLFEAAGFGFEIAGVKQKLAHSCIFCYFVGDENSDYTDLITLLYRATHMM